MEVDAEASELRTSIRGVRDARVAIVALRMRGQSRGDSLLDLLAAQRAFRQRHDDAFDPDLRRRACDEKEIASRSGDDVRPAWRTLLDSKEQRAHEYGVRPRAEQEALA